MGTICAGRFECFSPVNPEPHKFDHEYIIKAPPQDFEPDPRGMGVAFLDAMLENKDKIAQINVQTGEKQTFELIRERAIRVAVAMKSQGIGPGDIITSCSFNNMESCLPVIAAQCLGAIVASLDPTLSPADTVYLMNKVRPKMIFCGPEALELIEKAVEETKLEPIIVVYGDTEVYIPFEDFIQPSEDGETFKPYCAPSYGDTAIVFFSSGTTGFPKGICLSHYAVMVQSMSMFGMDTSVICIFSSLYWISAVIILTASLLTGRCRLISPQFHPVLAWKILSNYKATMAFLAPIQVLFMIKFGRPENLDLSSLRNLILGGGAMGKEQILLVRKVFPEAFVSIGYGQTETAGIVTIFNVSLEEDRECMKKYPNSCGRPIPGFTYKIVDPETEKLLGPNENGELRLYIECGMNGYYEQDSKEVWDSDGWLRTGDVAYYNEDKCFFIVDRIKDMLKFQSWHVVPAMLEAVLMSHPAVQEAVVIGIPHEEDGDHPMGVVVLVKPPPEEEVTPEILEKYVEERVHDRQRLRAGVKIIDTIPKTPSAKPKRKEIRDMVLAGKL